MLKEFLVLAITAFCLAKATESRTADMDFLHKQKRVYELFMYIDQAKFYGSDCYEVGRTYDIEGNVDFYNDKMIVKEFMYRFKLGMLRRGALFSVYYKEHRDELRVLFRLLYSAKDFITFYKTACFFRLYLNQGMFITALTTAVMYRPDCKHIILPPMYEVYPHLFFDNEYIQEAHRYKMTTGFKKVGGYEHIDTFLIDKNYTSSFMKYYVDKEYALDYFTDDIGLNNYYYYVRNLFPFWITIKDLDLPKHIRGELYYYVHQQLLARYYLERLSNGLGEIEDFSMYKDFGPGYFSTLVYSNGVSVPNRDRYMSIPSYKYKYVKEIENVELRILAAIDSGYLIDFEGKQIGLYSHEGLNFLGNIIEGNYDSCNTRFYGAIDALYRDIFGFNYDCKHKHCVVPSALQTYMASLRDPAFYRLYKRIIGYFLRYKCHVPTYTASELEFAGVKIQDAFADKFYTYMEPFETFINNAVTVENLKEGFSFNIKAKKYRLNYKPFTFKFNVLSDKVSKGVVRIFLGPSLDDFYFKEENYMYYNFYNFVELDKFFVDLKPGVNLIERLSTNSIFTAKDFVGGDYFYKKLLKAIEGNEPFTYTDKVYGFPNNLYLPKGKVGGMPFKLFVCICPVDESKLTYIDLPIFGKFLYDGKPLGFPLDRPILPYMMDMSNFFMKDVYIYFSKNITMLDDFYYHKDVSKDYIHSEAGLKIEALKKPYYFMDYDKSIVF